MYRNRYADPVTSLLDQWEEVGYAQGQHCKHFETSKDFVIDQADVLQDGKISKMELTLVSLRVRLGA